MILVRTYSLEQKSSFVLYEIAFAEFEDLWVFVIFDMEFENFGHVGRFI